MTLLTTPEDFARSRGVTFDPTDVAAIIALEGASGAIRSYCGQTFDYTADETITLDGTGTAALVLPELPVVSVSNVAVTEWNDTVTNLTVTTDYTLGSAGILYREPWPTVWTKGHANVSLKVTHGYVMPGDVDVTLPTEIQMVCIQLALRLYTSATSGGQTISAEQIGTTRFEYESGGTEAGDLTGLERGILDRYRRAGLA